MRLGLYSLLILAPVAQASDFNNSAFSYYCASEKGAFFEQVNAGDARVIQPLHDSKVQTVSYGLSTSVSLVYVQGGVDSGVEAECMNYLLTQASEPKDGNSLVLARVTFDFDKTKLTNESKFILQQLKGKLAGEKGNFVIEGHTDSIGDKEYNFDLGLKRSQSVIEFLDNDKVELTPKSYGETQPYTDEATDEKRRLNRRVEVSRG